MPAVKTPVGAVAKNTENCFHGGNVAYLWSRCFMSKKGVAPLRELLYNREIYMFNGISGDILRWTRIVVLK